MSTRSRVCVGIPVHNGARYLPEALESLLAQSYRDFRVVAVNDGSTDGSDALLRNYAARDSRLLYVPLTRRTGMVAAWRRVFELADAECRPEFFAWFGDHDRVEATWLERLVSGIQGREDVALAHAATRHIGLEGEPLDLALPGGVDTTGLTPWRRFERVTLESLGAGDAVYGLFRADILKRCGIFRPELMPDRVLVSEINLYGAMRFVPEAVRFRRRTFVSEGKVDFLSRQLRTLFPEGDTRQAPYQSHVTFFLRQVLTEPSSDPELQAHRLYHAMLFFSKQTQHFAEALLQEFESGQRPDGFAFLGELAASCARQPGLVTWPLFHAYVEKNRHKAEKIRKLQFVREQLQKQIQMAKGSRLARIARSLMGRGGDS